MASTGTKKLLLDCAEKLFAQEGFHHTSMRVLTNQAGVNLAAVNYHFGSKENLLHAVIERRLKPLNTKRFNAIEMVVAQAQKNRSTPSVQDLLLAFLRPTFEFRCASEEAKDFIHLIGRSWNDPDQTVYNCFIKLAMPLFEFFASCLRLSLPHLNEPVFQARLQFLIGSISAVMCDNEPGYSRKSFISVTMKEEEKMNQLLKFLQAGLEAPQ